MKISEVYGTSNNELLKSISTSEKSMFIDFKKQTQLGDVEFKASIIYNKLMSGCQTWLDVNKDILMSPNHPNKSNCSWLITSNFGSYIILNFKFIQVNSNLE